MTYEIHQRIERQTGLELSKLVEPELLASRSAGFKRYIMNILSGANSAKSWILFE